MKIRSFSPERNPDRNLSVWKDCCDISDSALEFIIPLPLDPSLRRHDIPSFRMMFVNSTDHMTSLLNAVESNGILVSPRFHLEWEFYFGDWQ